MSSSRNSDGRLEDTFRMAAMEFRERLRKSRMSVDSVWNASVRHCISLFGQPCPVGHDIEECETCWVHEKLRGALRLDDSVYIPLKERMFRSLARMRQTCTLDGPELVSYLQALEDMEYEMKKIVDNAE